MTEKQQSSRSSCSSGMKIYLLKKKKCSIQFRISLHSRQCLCRQTFLWLTPLVGCECKHVIIILSKINLWICLLWTQRLKLKKYLKYCKDFLIDFYRHKRKEIIIYSNVFTLKGILQNWSAPRRSNRINEGFRNHAALV